MSAENFGAHIATAGAPWEVTLGGRERAPARRGSGTARLRHWQRLEAGGGRERRQELPALPLAVGRKS